MIFLDLDSEVSLKSLKSGPNLVNCFHQNDEFYSIKLHSSNSLHADNQ